jgi:hypothetical protein
LRGADELKKDLVYEYLNPTLVDTVVFYMEYGCLFAMLDLTPKVLYDFKLKNSSKHPFLKQAIHLIFLNSYLESNYKIF